MMRHLLRAAAIAAIFVAAVQPAQAQGFLKRLADRALQKVEQQAEQVAEGGTGGGEPAPARTANRSAPPPVMTPRAVRGSAPRVAAPVAAPAPAAAMPARYTDNLPVPPEAETAKAAYNKFGEVSCNDCEGGIELDGRPKFAFDQFSGQYAERARRAGSWPVGHVHRWQGRASAGTLTVVAEENVDGFRCRRLLYRLVRGKASAERPGLVCWGLANRSSSNENWHEIY